MRNRLCEICEERPAVEKIDLYLGEIYVNSLRVCTAGCGIHPHLDAEKFKEKIRAHPLFGRPMSE